MYEFFTGNNLISLKFQVGDPCINQLLVITHGIYKSFEDGVEVRGILLDISKAFDKVWHKGLLYKLKLNGISGKLFDTITVFLNVRKQGVVLDGQYSSWTSIEAGVPQGSLFGPLLFVIYITLHKKWSFSLKIFSVNVTKSAVSCRFGHIYWRNL